MPRIADLILRKGDALAQAQLGSGQAWGGMVQQLGQIPGQVIGEQQRMKDVGLQRDYQRARTTELTTQAETQRLAARKALTLEQQNTYIDTLMQKSMKADPATGVTTFDRPTFEQGLVSGGKGHLYPALSQTLDQLDASASKRMTEGRSMLARSLFGVAQAGYTPEAVLSAAAFLKANHVITAEHLEPVMQALSQDASPEAVKALVTKLGGALPEYGALQQAYEKSQAELAKTKADTAKTAADTAKVEGETARGPVETRSLELQANEALKRGDTAEYSRLLKVAKDVRQADDRAFQPIVIQTAVGPQLLDRGAGTTRPITDAGGAVVQPAPTADMRNKVAARELVAKSITAIEELSKKVITKRGIAQRATAAGRSVESALGNDPEFRVYQDARMALAGNLAVGQQGARPSDADIKAIWLPLVPDMFRDTDESAAMKWSLIHTMSNTGTTPTTPSTAEEWGRDASGKLVKKGGQ